MKRILSFIMAACLMAAFSLSAVAQKSDCKFVKMKNADGSTFDAVQTTSKLGNLYIGKSNGKLVFIYTTKGVYDLIRPDNPAYLKIDTIKFVFANNKVVAVKATWGFGVAKNTTREMQPHMTNAKFGVALDPNSQEAQLLLSNATAAVVAFGQNSSVYGDELSEKQQAKLTDALRCNQ